MEIQEIIKIVGGWELSPLSEGTDEEIEKNNEAVREACALLKRDIPMSVLPAYQNKRLGGWYRCPACNDIVARRDQVILPDYCRFCGQALSWKGGR